MVYVPYLSYTSQRQPPPPSVESSQICDDKESVHQAPAVDKVRASPTAGAASCKRKAKLTVKGHGTEELTLAPKLPFGSYELLKEAVENILLALPAPAVSLSSLQYLDADGDLIDLDADGDLIAIIEPTFDPQDFVPAGGEGIGDHKVHLIARVTLEAQEVQSSRQQRQQQQQYAGNISAKSKVAAGRRPLTGRVLGGRDPNSTSTMVTPSTACKTKTRTTRKPPVMETVSRTKQQASASASTPVATPSQSITKKTGRENVTAAKSSRKGHVPRFVFGVKSREGRSATVTVTPASSKAATVPAGGRRRGDRGKEARAAGVAMDSARKPVWNDRAEPQWEEAERKRQEMRKAARARILRKRAAAAAKRNQKVIGGQVRVIRRAKRSCLVTDARRRSMGAYLFHDPIGTPPPSLGKRPLSKFRELGRQAALTMKYVPILPEESAPKRARGEGKDLGIVIPRGQYGGADGATDGDSATAKAAGCTSSTAPPEQSHHKGNGDKRTAAVRSFPSRPKPPPPPPTMRPGDIGFRGRTAPGGAIMRPPTLSASSRRSAAAAKAAAASGRGAAALTAAAAAKVESAADTTSWSGKLRAPMSSTGHAIPAAGGATARAEVGHTGGRSGATARRGRKEAGGAAGAASADDKAAAEAIMAKLRGRGARGGVGGGHSGTGGVGAGRGGGDVESLQEQVALLKAATGLSDEELMWRMETSKPEANAYRIASAALERAETSYERLLWRQGQLQIARARFTGRGSGGDNATSSFVTALGRVVSSGAPNDRALSRIKKSADAVLATLKTSEAAGAAATNTPNVGPSGTPSFNIGTATASNSSSSSGSGAAGSNALWPADAAAVYIRAAAERMARLTDAVAATARTGSEVDRPAVAREISEEAKALSARGDAVERDLRALTPKVEAAVGQVEAWQRRRSSAPEFAAEEAAREEAWSEANREVNLAAMREMRRLLPEAVWEMKAADIQAAAAAAAVESSGGAQGEGAASGIDSGAGDRASNGGGSAKRRVFYPSDLSVRLRECRPLHWLVSAPEDVETSNFLTGEGAAAFTQLEGMDVVEMRAIWCVLPKQFARDADGRKAEWRKRFRTQLEGLVQQQDRAVVAAGWDPVRNRRATCRMPPLPSHRARHPAYFYPTLEVTRTRIDKLREQHSRLERQKARLSALEAELSEAKAEVDSACADARSEALRSNYGADTLRCAREAAKEAYSALLRERKSLLGSVAEGERTLASAYPSLPQLESEAESIAEIFSSNADSSAAAPSEKGMKGNTTEPCPKDRSVVGAASGGNDKSRAVPGAFSAEPKLRRRASAVAKKLSPEEERRRRAAEVQHAVSSREMTGDPTTTVEMRATGDRDGGDNESRKRHGLEAGAAVVGQDAGSTAGGQALEHSNGAACERSVTAAGAAGAAGGSRAVSKVKVAPEVLAFLNREYSSRAAAASAAVAVSTAGPPSTDTADSLPGLRSIEGSVSGRPTPAVAAAAQGSGGSIGGESVVGAPLTIPPPAPPLRPKAVPKPMSKSLAAMIARKAAGEGSRGGGALKAGAPSLGFLEELKARAAEGRLKGSNEKTSAVDAGDVAGGAGTWSGGGRKAGTALSIVGGPGVRAGKPPLGVGSSIGAASFLDELKARTTIIS